MPIPWGSFRRHCCAEEDRRFRKDHAYRVVDHREDETGVLAVLEYSAARKRLRRESLPPAKCVPPAGDAQLLAAGMQSYRIAGVSAHCDPSHECRSTGAVEYTAVQP